MKIVNVLIAISTTLLISLLVCIGLFIDRVVPDTLYVHDPEAFYALRSTTHEQAYVMRYGDDIFTSSGDMTVAYSVEGGNVLSLKYKEPSEKGGSYRQTLDITRGDVALLDEREYHRISPWNVFHLALYQNPLEYFLTVSSLRQW